MQASADDGTHSKLKWRGLTIPWFAPPNDEYEYMTISNAAAYLGLSERAIRRWCQTGRISAQKRGWRWWIRRDELAQLTTDQLSPAVSETIDETLSDRDFLDELFEDAHVVDNHNGTD